MSLIGASYNGAHNDGSWVGRNPSSLVAPGAKRRYEYTARHEGTFLFQDMGNVAGHTGGTNVQGLFGALVVEPPGSTWTPSTCATCDPDHGLRMDVHPPRAGPLVAPEPWIAPSRKYFPVHRSFREFVTFFHDESEWERNDPWPIPNPCRAGSTEDVGTCAVFALVPFHVLTVTVLCSAIGDAVQDG